MTSAATVHGFTSAFAVGVGIMALAAIVVVTLIRPGNGDTSSQEPVYDGDDVVVGELAAA